MKVKTNFRYSFTILLVQVKLHNPTRVHSKSEPRWEDIVKGVDGVQVKENSL